MKKSLILTLLMAFVLVAQASSPDPGRANGTHWSFQTNYEHNLTVTGVIYLDGVSLQNNPRAANLEIGAFCGNECRGSYLPDLVSLPFFNGYAYQMQVYSNQASGEQIVFRVYDHESESELDLTCTSNIQFTANAQYGNLRNPYELVFYTNFNVSATVNPTQSGSVTGTGSYSYGSTCTLTATPNVGYHFVNWTKNGVFVSSETEISFEVFEDVTYQANFEINVYGITVMANPTEGGSVSGAGSYTHGSTCTLTATAATGYNFVNWTLNGNVVSSNSTYNFTVTGAGDYVANFTLKTYSITASANPSSGGTVSGAGSYTHGSSCTLTATANTGYTFSNWTKNGTVVSTSSTYNFTVTGSGSYVAHFTLNSYDINISAQPAQAGAVSGGGTYLHGSTCELSATPNEGYLFVNWTENGAQVSNNANYSFTVTGNRNLVANFALAYHWSVDYSQFPFNMSVTGVIVIDGIEQTTDMLEIGAFCGEECRGREKLVYVPSANRYIAYLTIYGNEGDVNNFRLYDHALGEESNKTCLESITFSANGIVGSLTSPFVFHFGDIQSTDFIAGWNWYSTYIDQEDINGLEILQYSLGTNGIAIKSQNDGYTDYYDDYDIWYGSLESVRNETFYMVNTNAPCHVDMVGIVADPVDHPITLNASGWTWIGYPVSYEMGIDEAFSNILPIESDMLKAQLGYAEFYEGYGWYGTLETIAPGGGLMYLSHNANPITFTYPTGTRSSKPSKSFSDESKHWEPNLYAYPNNMTVTAIVEMDDKELESDQYELAAFVNGECRGSVRLHYVEPIDRYVAFLTIAGEEAFALEFGLYDAISGNEYYSAENRISFDADAIVGKLKDPFKIAFRGYTGIEGLESQLHVYPNPVSANQPISVGVLAESCQPVQVEIVNVLGSVIWNETLTSFPCSIQSPSSSGIYMVRFSTEDGGTYCYKLIVK